MPRWTKRKIDDANFSENPGYHIRIEDIRKSLSIDRNTLARILKVDEVTFLHYEKGYTHELRIETIMDMALEMGISADYILGLTDIPDAYNESLHMPEALTTERVREYRLYRGYTSRAVSERLDISISALSTKELHPEKLSFTIQDLILLAYLFETSVDYLLHLTDEVIPHARGCHHKIPVGRNLAFQIKKKLGLMNIPGNRTDEAAKYCLEHFRLREIRLEHNARQKDLAKLLGINIMTYGDYERKPHLLPAYYAVKLAQYYGCSIDYLVGLSDVYYPADKQNKK